MDAPDPAGRESVPGTRRFRASAGVPSSEEATAPLSSARDKVLEHFAAIGGPAEPGRTIEQQPIRRADPTDGTLTWDEGQRKARLCRIGFFMASYERLGAFLPADTIQQPGAAWDAPSFQIGRAHV